MQKKWRLTSRKRRKRPKIPSGGADENPEAGSWIGML